jgi:hypothetical protein
MASALTTIENVKASLVFTTTSAADTLISRLIDEVAATAETICGRHFLLADYEETFDGDGGESLFLPAWPVWEVTEVLVDEEDVTDDVDTNLTIGELHYSAGFTEDFQNVTVTYSAGYDCGEESEHPVPADLEGAVIAEVCARFENFQSESKTGENLVDLRTRFLSGTANSYFQRERKRNV